MKHWALLVATATFIAQQAVADQYCESKIKKTNVVAYLHAFASGPKHQIIASLPMERDFVKRLIGVHGSSPITENGYAWQLTGDYNEDCAYQSTRTYEPVFANLYNWIETGVTPKKQNLVVLDDFSFLFTCERSGIVLKHPNTMGTDFTEIATEYPEINLDLSGYTHPFFDGIAFSNKGSEYGISLAYNQSAKLVYVGLEDQVYVLDLKKWQHSEKARSQPGGALRLKKIRPDPNFFYPLKTDDEYHAPHEGYAIINLALVYQPDGNHYLFASSATPNKAWAKTPIKMALLSKDGTTTSGWQEAPFNPALQYASLDWKHDRRGVSFPKGTGIEGDITEIASDTTFNPEQPAVLAARIHNGGVTAILEPQHQNELFRLRLEELENQSMLDQHHMNPEVYNLASRDSASHQTGRNGARDNDQPRIIRLIEYVIDRFADIKPNYHSGNQKILRQLKRGERPEQNLSNEVITIYDQTLFSMPWKNDISLKIMSYSLKSAWEELSGWEDQTRVRWFKPAELPDMAKKRPPLYKKGSLTTPVETFSKPEPAWWWSGGDYWSDIHVSPPPKDSHITDNCSEKRE